MRADGGFGGGGGGGGVSVDLTPLLRWLLTPAGLVVVAVVVLIVVLLIVIAALLIRRAIRRRLPAGRQLVDRAVTGWRAQTLPAGPHRRVAELRAQLETEMAATARQAGELHATSAPVGMLPELTGQLTEAGRALDEHLRWLEREPDDTRLTATLPAAEQQIREWCAASASLRETARSAALAVSAGQLTDLTSQVEVEVASVQAGVDYLKTQKRLDG